MEPVSCLRAPARARPPALGKAGARARHRAAVDLVGRRTGSVCGGVVGRLNQGSNCMWLAGTERDDAPDGIVRGNADRHTISRDNLDAEAAHPAAQLGKHFVAGVALHAVKTAAVDRDHRPLHVNQIVLAQSC